MPNDIFEPGFDLDEAGTQLGDVCEKMQNATESNSGKSVSPMRPTMQNAEKEKILDPREAILAEILGQTFSVEKSVKSLANSIHVFEGRIDDLAKKYVEQIARERVDELLKESISLMVKSSVDVKRASDEAIAKLKKIRGNQFFDEEIEATKEEGGIVKKFILWSLSTIVTVGLTSVTILYFSQHHITL